MPDSLSGSFPVGPGPYAGDLPEEAAGGMRSRIADPHTRVSYAILCFSTLLLAAVFVIGDRMAPAGRRLAKIAGEVKELCGKYPAPGIKV